MLSVRTIPSLISNLVAHPHGEAIASGVQPAMLLCVERLNWLSGLGSMMHLYDHQHHSSIASDLNSGSTCQATALSRRVHCAKNVTRTDGLHELQPPTHAEPSRTTRLPM